MWRKVHSKFMSWNLILLSLVKILVISYIPGGDAEPREILVE